LLPQRLVGDRNFVVNATAGTPRHALRRSGANAKPCRRLDEMAPRGPHPQRIPDNGGRAEQSRRQSTMQ
jgi:hypothetical protein